MALSATTFAALPAGYSSIFAVHGMALVNAGHRPLSIATMSPPGSVNPLAEVIVRRQTATVGSATCGRPPRASKNGSRVISDGEIVVKRRVR
jgi:hypothetical protein